LEIFDTEGEMVKWRDGEVDVVVAQLMQLVPQLTSSLPHQLIN
jgi:hypothetical protein